MNKLLQNSSVSKNRNFSFLGKLIRYNFILLQKSIKLKTLGYIFFSLLHGSLFSEEFEDDYWKQKTLCNKRNYECFVNCINSYGIDYYNPPMSSPLLSTYNIVCKNQCNALHDCNNVYNRLKEKGAIK